MATRKSKIFKYQRLPIEIRRGDRFVNWVIGDAGAKVPVSPSGQNINVNDTDNHVSFTRAVRAVEKGRAFGIGLPIIDGEFCAIDIDHCIVDGEIAPWAVEILERCDSYTEFSPSWSGLHIYMMGRPKTGDKRQIAVGDGQIDIFASKGYLTLTGRPVPGYADKKTLKRAKIVDRIVSQFAASSAVIKKIKKNKEMARLWRGQIGDDEDRSEKDYAIAAFIAPLAEYDADKIEFIMRQAPLSREKWDRPGDPYLKRTIRKVLDESGKSRQLIVESIRDLVCPVGEFMQKDLPPPEWLVKGLLAEGTINMVFGPGGVGKSHFLYSLMHSLDQSKRFMHWNVPEPKRALYIDTEMPERLIQKRLMGWFGSEHSAGSFLMSLALFRRTSGQHFKLDDEAHQDILRQLIREYHIEVVIIDPLAPALDCDENSNTEVQLYMEFLTELRDDGITVVLSHHSGKSEESGQRGASRRRDYLDLNIKLSNVKVGKNARFRAEIEKVREETPVPAVWVAELCWEDGTHHWKLGADTGADETLLQVLMYIDRIQKEGGKFVVSKMAEELEIVRERSYNYFKSARAQGLLHPEKYELTPSGRTLVAEIDFEDES